MTATDGNHGYGVAFIAQLFRCRAKVTLGKIYYINFISDVINISIERSMIKTISSALSPRS